MAKKMYDEARVIRVLQRNPDVNVNTVEKCIYIIKHSNRLGNGSLGKIDYLVNYCGYDKVFTNTLGKYKNSKPKDTNTTESDNIPMYHTKRYKLDMVSMVKKNIRRVK